MSEPDLNLLRIFDLLFEERSVTRVAQRASLTQSAISHALRRLRQSVGDPLFTRQPGGLQPTARAEELAPKIREILVQIRGALAPPLFDASTSDRRFTIAAGSYFCRLIVPRLIGLARQRAPGVTLRIVNIDQALVDELDEGTIDLALGSFERIPARIEARLLFRETLVWVSGRGHPLAGGRPDSATLAALPRVAVVADYPFRAVIRAGSGERIERHRATEGHVRELGMGLEVPSVPTIEVYDAETAMAVVGSTDLVAVLPRRLTVARLAERGLHLFDAAATGADIDLQMLWHSRFGHDPGLAWLRDLVDEAKD